MPVTLSNIKSDDTVKYRIGLAGRNDVDWEQWKTTNFIYVLRREQTIRRSIQRKHHVAGQIVTLTILNEVCPDFSIDDLCEDKDSVIFNVEDYYLQLDIPKE